MHERKAWLLAGSELAGQRAAEAKAVARRLDRVKGGVAGRLHNTNQAITQVRVSPVSSGNWGAPFKRTFVHHSGGRQRMEFAYGDAYSTTCHYDVRVRFSGGHQTYWNNIALCRTNGLDVDVVLGQLVGATF